ncbi:FHA domain-containing protein [Undibacterium sp. SXout7W]|uniref:FHA domain-containing protein n=1 Tax=Undibacterium sp. SXout7W TaxID=3413049 RepID=UPI003BF392AB
MYELRILSGLHRGATLPLYDETHTIGASDEADVVLVDTCVQTLHATLSKTENGWLLSARDGQIFDAETNEHKTFIDLQPGEFVRIGDIWIVIQSEGEPWPDVPPVPEDLPLVSEQFMDAEESVQENSESLNIEISPADIEEHRAAVQEHVKPKRRFFGRRIVIGAMVTTVVLSAAATYAMTDRTALSGLSKLSNLSDPKSGVSRLMNEQSAKQTPELADESDADTKKNAEKPAGLTPDALRKVFRKRLADADLLRQFDMTLEDRYWQMQADLDEEETKRFDKILQKFMAQYQIDFPVHAKIVKSEGMLPFKVIQVISGTNPNIVTQDGQRMFVGEEYRGVRLLAIQENHLTFAGKRKIEMNW